MQQLPILYSFRRCPYAIRARMALCYSDVRVELREVLLKDKPAQMLAASQKGTVPVLVLPDGRVIDESIEVMRWALRQADTQAWLPEQSLKSTGTQGFAINGEHDDLIAENDGAFKGWLDKYKYADRFPAQDAAWYRAQGESFLVTLDSQLANAAWLSGAAMGFTDVAVFPFIRQFAGVDPAWFEQAPYPKLRAWLALLLQHPLFTQVMEKHPPWSGLDTPTLFPS